MNKTVFRRFCYTQCDDFAAYLEEMSAAGWHFKEWRTGLVFEKGTPLKVCYDVEVFPKGREGDTRAEEDALEYAQYCKAAGWELIDAKKRFCIFRKVCDTACDIVSPEEKLANIKSAEWRRWISLAPGIWLVCALDWMQFWHWFFKVWISNWMFLTILFLISVMAIEKAVEGIWLLIWGQRMERKLKEGREVYYGSGGIVGKIFQKTGPFLYVIVEIILLTASVASGQWQTALVVAVLLTVVFLFYVWLSRKRLHRTENRILQAAFGLIMPLSVVGVAAMIYEGDGDVYTQKSIFGSVKVYEDIRNTEIYESDFGWVLDRIWEKETGKPESMTGGSSVIRCPGMVVIDRTGESSDKEK